MRPTDLTLSSSPLTLASVLGHRPANVTTPYHQAGVKRYTKRESEREKEQRGRMLLLLPQKGTHTPLTALGIGPQLLALTESPFRPWKKRAASA